MTTRVNMKSQNLTITPSMSKKTQELFNKLFSRYDCISHSVTATATAKGVELVGIYQHGSFHKTAKLTDADFYTGIRLLRDSLISQIEKAVSSSTDKKRTNKRAELVDAEE